MRNLTRVLLSLSVLTMTACSSVSNVSYPLSDGTFTNQRTVTDPHAFAPTHSRSWIENCQAKADNPKKPDYAACTAQSDSRYATSTGYLDGLGAAALYSGAIVGGAALIGDGLKHSGSTNNMSNGSSSRSGSSSIGVGNGGNSSATATGGAGGAGGHGTGIGVGIGGGSNPGLGQGGPH